MDFSITLDTRFKCCIKLEKPANPFVNDVGAHEIPNHPPPGNTPLPPPPKKKPAGTLKINEKNVL